MALTVVRITAAAAVLALLALAVRHRVTLREHLRSFFLEPTSAVNPALLRIVIFLLVFQSAFAARPEWHAAIPAGFRSSPPGWGWLGDLPFQPTVALVAGKLLIVTSGAACVGLFTRVSVPLAAVLAVYVVGLPYFFGKINHGAMVRTLSALALSLSPVGDALSIDRLVRRLRGHAPPAPSPAYTLPVRSIWLIIGTTYFFPGLWKLWTSGDLWMFGDQLKFELLRRWASAPDFVPTFRIDQHPWPLRLLGAGTIALELGFVFAMFYRRARIATALAAASFHLGVAHLMGIRFPLYVPLLVLLEVETWASVRPRMSETVTRGWTRLRARLDGLVPAWVRATPTVPDVKPSRDLRPAAVLVGVLLFGQLYTGFARVSSWPISVYPSFSARKTSAPKRGKGVCLLLERRNGDVVDVDEAMARYYFANRRRIVDRIESSTRKGDPSRGRLAVAFLRYIGVRVRAGDQLAVIPKSWDALPPGARANYEEGRVRRYRVKKDSTLVRVDPGKESAEKKNEGERRVGASCSP
jgi:hypothetical protein